MIYRTGKIRCMSSVNVILVSFMAYNVGLVIADQWVTLSIETLVGNGTCKNFALNSQWMFIYYDQWCWKGESEHK
jgi:hypothetical protein